MDYILLIVGILTLTFSGNYLVKAAVELSKALKMSTLVIGIVVVSFGTSMPELVVSVGAALNNHPEISVGNVIGSNIANIVLVLGITALIIPIPVKKSTIKIDWNIMLLASLLLIAFLLDSKLVFWEGLVFVILLISYILLSLIISRRRTKKNNEIKKPEYSLSFSIILIIISSVGLVFGAEWLIQGATGIAVGLGVSDLVISVSLVAFGTSVPELATSIIAALKKETDISIGNIIGSNIFNIFGILGITSVIKSINIINPNLYINLYWMLAAAFLLLLFLIPFGKKISARFVEIIYFVVYYSTAKSGIIKKWEGGLFVSFYIIYIIWLINGSF